MTGRGKGGKGLGKGGAKRHRKILRDNIQGITKPAIRRLARRGGVKRISGLIYEETRGVLKIFLENIIRDSVTYTEHAKRKTVTALDVVYALKSSNMSSTTTDPKVATAISTPSVIPPTLSASNPWVDDTIGAITHAAATATDTPLTPIPPHELELTSPKSAFDDGIVPPSPAKVAVDVSLLNEFDPLVDTGQAWSTSKGHPPQPPTDDPPPTNPAPPPQPAQTSSGLSFGHRISPSLGKISLSKRFRRPSTDLDTPTSAAANVTTFATLASLARSPFGGGRDRSGSSALAQTPSKTSLVGTASEPSTPQKTETALPPSSSAERPPAVPVKDERTASESSQNTVVAGGESSNSATPSEPVFDFQKFLDQMKTKSAEPVAKYLRSFLNNFAKRNFTVTDQIQLIRGFQDFIIVKMRDCSVWRNASDSEFENATEAMEKLVMNRLYDYTFTPQIDQMTHPVTTDDLERDHILRQRMKLFVWVKEEHLDVPVGEGSQGFLAFAQQGRSGSPAGEKNAPRDKLICILNCCKVIFGLIRHLGREEGADSFIPILIFVVLKSNPEHVISNIEYINRFRSPDKLQSEAGYYLSSLTGAVSFIETMDHSSLSCITQEQFETNVEMAIQALPLSPELNAPDAPQFSSSPGRPRTPSSQQAHLINSPKARASPHTGEEPAVPLKLPSTATIAEDTKRFLQRTGDSISKPLNAIGKIFNEALDGLDERDREREQRRGSTDIGGGADLAGNLLANVTPDWLFGGSGSGTPVRATTPNVAQTPIGGGGPVQVAQTPYRPRMRPGSAGGPGPRHGSLTPEPTPTQFGRNPSYGFGSPLSGSGSTSLPGTPNRPLVLDFQQQQRQPQPRQQQQRPPTQQLQTNHSHLGMPSPDPRSGGTDASLELTALQNEIDRAHNAANEASRGTLLQMFPGCDPEVVDMVLEANRGDLGMSIDQLLEMTVVV
ncbi:hypothetical protein FRB96_007282 [Tulasnella sp. 330]|nr:hypothetical protein FRB96_007282 [Tulasnella sp. 330]